MRVRLVASTAVLLVLSACGGGPTASGPAAPGGSPGAAVDLSGIDACELVDESTVETVTGESGFATDQFGNTHCFWGVTRPGVPEYLEIELSPRPGGLEGYEYTAANATCTSVPVSGAGVEARGGVCSGAQDKVYLLAWDRGVMLRVLVNEPPAGTTPASLATVAQGILDALS